MLVFYYSCTARHVYKWVIEWYVVNGYPIKCLFDKLRLVGVAVSINILNQLLSVHFHLLNNNVFVINLVYTTIIRHNLKMKISSYIDFLLVCVCVKWPSIKRDFRLILTQQGFCLLAFKDNKLCISYLLCVSHKVARIPSFFVGFFAITPFK